MLFLIPSEPFETSLPFSNESKIQVTTFASAFSRNVPLVSGTNNFIQVRWRIIIKQKKAKTTLAGKASTIDGRQ